MAYTITVTSTAENINNTPDTYQIVLTFAVDLVAANQAHDFIDKSLIILDHGKTKWAYKIEDSLVTPQSQSFTIADSAGYLRGLMFGTSAEQAATEKQFKINLKLNGTSIFKGTAIEDDITAEWIEDTTGAYIFRFSAFPEGIEEITKQELYHEDGTPVALFGYATGVPELITTMVDDIWGQMNGAITVDYNQSWLFRHVVAGENDIPFTDVGENPGAMWRLDQIAGISTTGDALKRLALEYGCFTGLKDWDNAFFTELFLYDAGNTQSLGTVHKKKEGYIWNLLYYVQTNVDGVGVLGTAGSYTNGIANQFLEIDDSYRGLVRHSTSNPLDEDHITGGAYDSLVNTLSDFWFDTRGDITKVRTDEFLVDGVDYDFTAFFTHDSFKYQIIEMEINWETGQTIIKAINLGT